MQKNIKEHLLSVYNKMFSQNSKVIVGFSGGVDSVVLLRTLLELRPDLNIIAGHCNHNLREDADNDANFCRQLCEELGVHFEQADLHVEEFCNTQKVGTEEGARILRHGFFEELKWSHNTEYLLLGHHANDRAETVFFNLLRGSGLGGLSAMKQADINRGIYRPLLGLEKGDIINLAVSSGYQWVEDHTNHETEYDRNWLRNLVFPMLSERRKGLVKILNRTAEQFDQINDYIECQAQGYLRNNICQNSAGNINFFDIYDFKEQHKALQNAVLLQIWNDVYGSSANFSVKIINEFNKWLLSDLTNGKSVDFGRKYRLVNRNGLLGIKSNKIDNELDINLRLVSSYCLNNECQDGLSIK